MPEEKDKKSKQRRYGPPKTLIDLFYKLKYSSVNVQMNKGQMMNELSTQKKR